MDTTKKCIPCQGGVPKTKFEEITQFLSKIDQDWMVEDDSFTKTLILLIRISGKFRK